MEAPGYCGYAHSQNHEWIDTADKYVCRFCPQETFNPYPGQCQGSSNDTLKGTHEFRAA
jgi:hypothetical protein